MTTKPLTPRSTAHRTPRAVLASALLALLAAACAPTRCDEPVATATGPATGPALDPSGFPVVVVGAGMAGLATAAALEANGIDAVVLEARDRIGGRTHTADVDRARIDLGGAWIHGPRRNPIARLARELGFDRTEHDPSIDRIASDDPLLDGVSEFELYERMMPLLAALMDDARHDEEERSVGAFVDEWIAQADLDERAARVTRFGVATLSVELDYACDVDELSLRWFYEEDGFDGGDWIVTGGYGGLVDGLREGLDVRLSQVVTQVRERDGFVEVETADGTTIAGRAAVVTVPLGVLRAEAIAFDPPLNEERRAAIARLGMAHLEKVVLRFDERFWANTFDDMIVVDAATDAGRFTSLYDFTELAGAPTLVALYGGGGSREVQESWSDERIVAGALAALELVLGEDAESPAPRATAVTRWHSDPFSLGSYSFVPVGASLADYATLAEPHGLVHFAGEATHAAHPSTVHGAFMSGLREARRLGADTDVFWAAVGE